MTTNPTAPIPLVDLVSMRICPNCNASGCRMCNGVGRVPVDPYRAGGGEQGDELADLITEQRARPAGRLVPTAMLKRLAELARVVRDPTNSTQVAEMCDLAEEVAGG